jgi:hypothetical protein
MTSDILIQRLRTLVGSRFRYLDITWRLAEILAQEDALVLVRCDEGEPCLQTSQYGQPMRRVPQTLTLPLTGDDRVGYSEDVIALLSGKLAES